MLDIGGWEFMLVAFVLILVVGPKELPKMLRSFTRILQQVRGMAREFSDGMNDLAREADMADLKKVMDDAKSGNIDQIADQLDGSGDIGASLSEFTETLNEPGGDLQIIGKEAAVTGESLAAEANKPVPAKKAAQKKAAQKKAAPKKAAPKTKAASKAKAGKGKGA